MEVSHCGNKDFRRGWEVCSSDLDIDTMTFIYELDLCILLSSDRHCRQTDTDKQTDTTEIIYHAASQVVNKRTDRSLLLDQLCAFINFFSIYKIRFVYFVEKYPP